MPAFSPLAADLRVDVAVIGAGITGLTTALALKQAGLSVAVLEQGGLALSQSAHTTAHLTMVFDTGLEQLERAVGQDGARMVWQAGRFAIDHIEALTRRHGLDCDFVRVPGYYFAARAEDLAAIEEEARRARALGFVADVVAERPFPMMRHGAMRVAHQARFHAGRYLAGLARLVHGGRGRIHTDTHVAQVDSGEHCHLEANGWVVTARHVVYATQQPIHDKSFAAKVPAYQTYVLGLRVAPGAVGDVLAWDTADPYHYWRVQPHGDCDVVIVGGADHRAGQEIHAAERYDCLEAYARAALGGIPFTVAYRWTGEWLEPIDGLPFIGPRDRSRRNEYIATGYSGNGLTMGTYAALVIAEHILGRQTMPAELFEARRLGLRAGAITFLTENAAYPAYYAGDRFAHPQATTLEALGPHQGGIVSLDGQPVAAYRNGEGRLSLCSAVCTHMGCLVHFDDADETWACPCHGSIFGTDGAVIAGPARTPLAPVETPVDRHR